jgi:lysophospholipase L1-like esterase
MLKVARLFLRLLAPVALPGFLLLTFTPLANAAGPDSSFHPTRLKPHYLALGDSLAFGFQPNGDFTHGYVPDLFQILHQKGVKDVTNLGCPGETSTTFIQGGICPYAPFSSQLAAAVYFLRQHPGTVGPVTFDIGANDILTPANFDLSTCTPNVSGFNTALATLDKNLTRIILPALRKALNTWDHLPGQIIMMNYYDPLQNLCPNTVPFVQIFDQHLARDVRGFGSIVDVFTAFGGPDAPNPNLCTYTWMCAAGDIHPTDLGYQVIADTFATRLIGD